MRRVESADLLTIHIVEGWHVLNIRHLRRLLYPVALSNFVMATRAKCRVSSIKSDRSGI